MFTLWSNAKALTACCGSMFLRRKWSAQSSLKASRGIIDVGHAFLLCIGGGTKD